MSPKKSHVASQVALISAHLAAEIRPFHSPGGVLQ